MYPDNEVPVSVMARSSNYLQVWMEDFNPHYQNTYDAKKDGDEEPVKENVDALIQELLTTEEEEDCESCKI